MFGAGREEVLVESKSWFAAKPYDWLGLNSAAFGLSVEQRMDCGLIRLEVAVARSRDESAWPSWRGAREVASMFLRCVEQFFFQFRVFLQILRERNPWDPVVCG